MMAPQLPQRHKLGWWMGRCWVSSDIHHITVTRINGSDTLPTNECMVYAYEIDGKMLLDSGVSVPTNIPSIAPTGCSVGTKQGFSIIKYGISGSSGYDTMAHGLTQAPEFGIFKCTSDNNTQWGVYHTLNGTNTNWIQLNDTAAHGTNGGNALAGGAYVGYTDSVVQIDRLAYTMQKVLLELDICGTVFLDYRNLAFMMELEVAVLPHS